ncbi:MAG: monooxygenase [Thermoleophilia bacterium]|nr:monooxygenase [Thermoleophilia bacterium]MDH5333006.1 monooxygenase [Thermoleophilia bacterium]
MRRPGPRARSGSFVRARGLLVVAIAAIAAVPLLGVLVLRGDDAQAGTTASPGFARDVAPIIRDKCAGCHRLGGIAPFPFRTARDVASRAPLIASVVRERRMPPWPPGPRSPRLVGQEQRTLTTRQRDTILRWIADGARLDARSVGRPATAIPKPRAGETVRTLTLPVPYRPRSAGGATDDYRCFLVDPKLTEDVFVTAARIDPDQAAVVHHVILFKVPPASVADAQRLDAKAPGPGWSCFGGSGIPEPDGRGLGGGLDDAPWITAWAPGWGSDRFREGTGVPLAAGSRVVMQVHYNLLNGRTPDRSSAVLTTVPATAGLRPLQTMLLPAPVELPCAKGESGPLCDRTAALFDLVRKYGQGAGLAPAGLLLLCGKNAATPRAGAVTTCDRRIGAPTTMQAVGGHMHLLGRSIRVELNPGTPRARVLLDLPAWDFHWQAIYQLAGPVQAGPGDVVRVTCRHDATLRRLAEPASARTPRYTMWGEGTTDEMCLGILQVTRP